MLLLFNFIFICNHLFIGPGGLDPYEVFEALPENMQTCFESQDIAGLQKLLAEMDAVEAKKVKYNNYNNIFSPVLVNFIINYYINFFIYSI
jgi:hypothetical protein